MFGLDFLLVVVIIILVIGAIFMASHIKSLNDMLDGAYQQRDMKSKLLEQAEKRVQSYSSIFSTMRLGFTIQPDTYKAIPYEEGVAVVTPSGMIVATFPDIENDENSAMVRAFAFAVGVNVMVAGGMNVDPEFSPREALVAWVDRLITKV